MTSKADQPGQGYARTPEEAEAMLTRLAGLGVKPTPGVVKREGLKARVLAALQQHGTLSAAAAAAGVSRATIYNWRDNDPAFAAEVHQWMHEGLEEELVESLYHIATSKDPKMANAAVRANELLLKSVNPDKYSDRVKVDQTLTVNNQVQVIHEVRDTLRTAQATRLQQLRANVIDADTQSRPSGAERGGEGEGA